MTLHTLLVIYLGSISVVTGLLFIFDKLAAQGNLRRVPESVLHSFELLGGVFMNLVLIYLIRHKNRKTSYNSYTWLIGILWILILLLFHYKNR